METANGAASAETEALDQLRLAAAAGSAPPPVPGSDVGGGLVTDAGAAQLAKLSGFISGKIAKVSNRALPELFSTKDENELADLLSPILVKHADRLGGWLEKWFDEILLGVFVAEKIMDAADLVKARRQQKETPPDAARAAA